ncbi:MAG: hypothetical protein HY898_28320 [Deltaproteobacteria bacterium]|nr:hypothetical protein [Deltaproteobacteria bacterium]
MDLPQVYEQLEALLFRLGIPVRCEPFDARLFGDLNVQGGLCKLRGSNVVVVDSRAPVADRVGVLAQILASFDLEGVYLPPQIRDLIAAHAAQMDAPLAEVIPFDRARTRSAQRDDEEPDEEA